MSRAYRSQLWVHARSALSAPAAAHAWVATDAGGKQSWREVAAQVIELQHELQTLLDAAATTDEPQAEAGAGDLRAERNDTGHTPGVRTHEAQPHPPLVGLYAHQSPEYVCMALATLASGAAFVPLDPAWPPARVQEVARLARLQLLLTTPELAAALQAALPPGSSCAHVHVVDLVARPPRDEQQRVSSTRDGSGEALGPEASGAIDPLPPPQQLPYLPYFCIIYTSGSTGVPQGVHQSEAAWLHRLRWGQAHYPLQAHRRLASDSSATGGASGEGAAGASDGGHGGESVVCFSTAVSFVDHLWQLLAPLVAPSLEAPIGACEAPGPGSVLVLPPHAALQPEVFADAIARHHVTHLVSVPSVYRHLLPALTAARSRLAALRVVVSSGEPLASTLAGQLHELLATGGRVLNLYGSTEVTADCTAYELPPPGAQLDAVSWVPAGWPIGDTQLLLVAGHADDGSGRSDVQLAPPGAVGEVWVGGSCVSAGYHATAQGHEEPRPSRFMHVQLPHSKAGCIACAAGVQPALEGMYFRTGDLGVMLPSGCLQLCGRTDQQIKVAGVRLDLAEVERVLLLHPAVADAAVRGARAGGGADAEAPAGGAMPSHGGSGSMGATGPPRVVAYVVLARQQLAAPEVREAATRRPEEPDATVEGAAALAAAGAVEHAQRLPDSTSGGPLPRVPEAAATLSGGGVRERVAAAEPLPAGMVLQLQALLAEHLPVRGGLAFCFVSVPHLPRNPAGKLLRGLLPEVPLHAHAAQLPPLQEQPGADSSGGNQPVLQAGGDAAPPMPHSEASVMRAIVAATGLMRLEPSDDIFAAGATSLAAAEVAGWLGCDVRLVLSYPTARSLAAALRHASSGGGGRGGEDGADAQLAGRAAKRPRRGGAARVEAPLVAAATEGAVHEGAFQLQAALRSWRRIVCTSSRGELLFEPTGSCRATQAPRFPSAAAQGVLPVPHSRIDGVYRYQLGRCVDAPVLHVRIEAHAQSGAGGVDASCSYILACSHDGDVALLDAAGGTPLWRQCLPARAEAGMALALGARLNHTRASEALRGGSACAEAGSPVLPHVVVACGDGILYSLDMGTGAVCGSVDCGGEFKRPPCTDPWTGAVWTTGHGRSVTVMRPPGVLLARLEMEAPMSTPVVFATIPCQGLAGAVPGLACTPSCGDGREQQQPWHLALVTALDGSVTALRVVSEGMQPSAPAVAAANGGASGMTLKRLWRLRPCSAPVFSAPLVLAGGPWAAGDEDGSAGGRRADGVVAVGHVDGTLYGVRLCTSATAATAEGPSTQPSPAWTLRLEGPLFADLAAASSSIILAATHAGLLYGIDAAAGALLWRADLGCGAISAAPAALGMGPAAGLCALVCTSSGRVMLVQLPQSSDARGGSRTASPELLCEGSLPGDVYSSPVLRVEAPGAATVYLGCRDDCVYALRVAITQ